MRINKKSFTLIEILVATIVFGIGILGIFALISDNIGLVQKVKIKTTGTFLARESLEYAYNLRDTNIFKGIDWRCIKLDAEYDCVNKFHIGNYYKLINNLSGNYQFESTKNTFDDNLIYYHTQDIKVGSENMSGFWYDHNPIGGEKTMFSRHVYISGAYLQGDSGIGDENMIVKIQSKVDFNKSSLIKGQIILESFIGQIK